MEIKLSLFPGDMILHTENPKCATRQLLELNEFGKFAGYRINIQKSVEFPYTKSELPKSESILTRQLINNKGGNNKGEKDSLFNKWC